MIDFPNAKINLGLNVVEKRADGFHNIETVFYPIQWKDALEIIPSDQFDLEIKGIITLLEPTLCLSCVRRVFYTNGSR